MVADAPRAGSVSAVRRIPSLGSDFTRLWLAGGVSSLGDGVSLAAGPLLLVSVTSDPRLIAGAMAVQWLPAMLLSLPAGALVDRLDRRRVCLASDALRLASFAVLALCVATGVASVAVIYLLLLIEGVGSIADRTSANALLPDLVSRADLPSANARLQGTSTVGAMLAGPPIGAALFLVSPWTPFAVDAVSFLGSFLVLTRLAWREHPRETADSTILRDVREGVVWLWHHTPLRTLAICIGLMNLTFGAVMSVLVIYTRERLGTGAAGYGALLTAAAVGGLAGSVLTSRLVARFGISWLLRVGLTIEALTHVGLVLSRNLAVAYVVMLAFGVHATVWNVVTTSLRQRAAPSGMQGRITGAYGLFSVGGNVLGAVFGGVLVEQAGITAPFWTSAVIVALLVVLAWRPFSHVGDVEPP